MSSKQSRAARKTLDILDPTATAWFALNLQMLINHPVEAQTAHQLPLINDRFEGFAGHNHSSL